MPLPGLPKPEGLTRRGLADTLPADDGSVGVFRIVDPPEPPEVELVERTFWIGTEPVTGVVVLRGDLDLSAVKPFEQALRAAVEHGGPVTLDVSDLQFMDSTGVRLLIHAAQRLQDRGCLILHGVNEAVQKVVDLTGIDQQENLHFIPHRHQVSDRSEAS